MTAIRAVNSKAVHPVDPRQQEGHPTMPADAHVLDFNEASPRSPERRRNIVVIVLGAILATAACSIIGVAFVQGSWWYSYGTDRALDGRSRARVEAMRDEVDASGIAPEAVPWLNAALDPHTDPSTVRAYLLAAQEVLEAADDPKLTEIVEELRAVVQTIQTYPVRHTSTPRPVPTLEWPW